MGLRVLITNNTLAGRAGSELYVRDVALALTARGHEPIAFSLFLGEVAAELREAGIAVVDDLRLLDHPPDLIHGQHHVETSMASLRFPKVPVLYFCHGVIPWEEMPPKLPTIHRYVAVDDACFEHITETHAIPAEKVTRIYNFADLDRFRPRSPLPEQPRNALVFSNYASRDTHLPVVEDACRELGIQVDVVGMSCGNPCPCPEKILGGYDVVFAKARAAIEALAVGCAVILCDARGAGTLVTSANVAELRHWNFGFRVLTAPLTAAHLQSQIKSYDAADAAAVSAWMRANGSMAQAINQIEEIYVQTVNEHRAMPPVPGGELIAAAADYLLVLARKIKGANVTRAA